jgi:hypothetical protein
MHYQSSAKKLFYALSVISDFNKQSVLTVDNELQPSSSIYLQIVVLFHRVTKLIIEQCQNTHDNFLLKYMYSEIVRQVFTNTHATLSGRTSPKYFQQTLID